MLLIRLFKNSQFMRIKFLQKSKRATVGILALIVLFGCDRKVSSPFEADLSRLLPAPVNVSAQLGVAGVFLSWQFSDMERVKEFNVYRQDPKSDGFSLVSTLKATSYKDTSLVTGAEYSYRISAVDLNGFEGVSSEEVKITPAIFSIIIEGGIEATNAGAVNLRLTAPENTSFMMLANDSTFQFSAWEPFLSARTWQLSSGDGLKTIYAMFRDINGFITKEPVTARIIRDSYAQIMSLSHDGYGRVLSAGDPLHIRLETNELNGTATASIINADTLNAGPNTGALKVLDIPLYDNGTRGDQVADDGVYETDYYIDRGLEMPSADVFGNFTDQLGNEAATLKAPTSFVLSQVPNAVILQEPANANQSTPALILRWTFNNEADFANYQIYRSTSFLVTLNSTLVADINDSRATYYVDTTIEPSTVYYYSVYVFDTAGNYSQSNIVSVRSPENKPPKPVVLSQAIGDSTSLTLTWSPSTTDDFANYQLFRSNTQPVDTSFAPILIVNEANTTKFRDISVVPNIDYYYQIFVSDEFGAMAGSNTVQGRLLP